MSVCIQVCLSTRVFMRTEAFEGVWETCEGVAHVGPQLPKVFFLHLLPLQAPSRATSFSQTNGIWLGQGRGEAGGAIPSRSHWFGDNYF